MDAYVPLQQQAYDYIRDLIAKGRLERGKFYSEKKIAADMQISRTPVRDAILRLSQDKYIDIVPSKGFQLHIMTEKDVWDAYEVRTAIEGFCALNLHANKNEPEGKKVIRLLRHDLEDMKEAVKNQEAADEILNYDFAFHRRIAESGRNSDFIKLFESYYHMLFNIADISFQDAERPGKAYEEHQAIFDYLTSDEEGAEVELYRSVVLHMRASRDIALSHMKEE